MLAAAIHLRVLFFGLVAFVPAADKKSVTVVLAEEPKSHHAFVSYSGVCAGKCQSKVDIFGLVIPGFELGGEDVSLTGITDASNDLILDGDGKAIGDLPDATTASYFSWVPSFDKIHPGSKIDSKCLNKSPCGQGNVKIMGRMTLKTGTLSTCQFREYADGKVHAIEFTPAEGRGMVTQAMAEFVVLDKMVDASNITLKVGSDSSVTLKPLGGEVIVYVGNLSRKIPGGMNDRKGEHFAHLHGLLSTALVTDLNLVLGKSTNVQPPCVATVPTELESSEIF